MRRLRSRFPWPVVLLALGCHTTTTVSGPMQSEVGGPIEETTVKVHRAPVDPRTTSAAEASLGDDELVLGVVAGGEARAYPIRYIAMYEVLNDRVGGVALAPTW